MADKLAGTKPPTASEVWFDTYLGAHGYEREIEPDLGVPKHPDRFVTRDGLSAVCEVKQFDKDPLAWMHATGQGGFFDEHKPVRSAVKQAADQLRPLEGRGLPLVVVLANPNGYHVALSGEQVVFALYGDDTLVFSVWQATVRRRRTSRTRRSTSASSGGTARSATWASTSARS